MELRTYKIIGMGVLIALIVSGLLTFISSGADTYGLSYEDDTMEEIVNTGQQFNQISEDVDLYNSNTTLSDDDFDKSGSLTKQALESWDSVKNSFTLFFVLINNSVNSLNLGGFGRVLVISIMGLITISLILGLGLYAWLKVRV